MSGKKVWFRNVSGEKLCGILHTPKVEKPPAILLVHGFGVTKDEDGSFTSTANELCKHGFAVLRFDFSGHGESEGKFIDVTITKEIHDLGKAIRFLCDQKIDKSSIGMIAMSTGALSSVLRKDKRVKALVLWSPVVKGNYSFNIIFTKYAGENWKRKIEENGFLRLVKKRRAIDVGKRFWYEVRETDLTESIKKLRIPLLILHGVKDEYIPMQHVKALYRAANQPKQLITFEEARHAIHEPKLERRAREIVIQWLEKELKKKK